MGAKRVFYFEVASLFWLDVAQTMKRDVGWHPVYWSTSDPQNRRVVERAFPGVIHHSRWSATRNVWPSALAAAPEVPLTGDLLRELASLESACLRMMDRMDADGKSFLYADRVRHYHRLLRKWQGVLYVLRPDVIVFQEVPGLVSDLTLYSLARRRGVQTVMFDRTWTPLSIYPMAMFERGSERLEERYAELLKMDEADPPPLPAQAEAHLQAMAGPHAEVRATVDHLFFVPEESRLRTRLRTARRLLHRVASEPLNLFAGRPGAITKVPGRPLEHAQPNSFRLRLQDARGDVVKRRLRRLYEEATRSPDLSRPYVYVPLHYQPEVTTSPLGGVFVDLEHMIRIISAAVPSGWSVLIREHPWTFKPGTEAHKSRSERFYEEIMGLPNVEFTSMELAPLDLIDGARAVATVSGTTGWEAVTRGIPALVFGYAWYRGCEGVHHVSSVEEVRSALEAIADGRGVDRHRLRLYVRALEDVSYRGYVQDEHAVLPEARAYDNVAVLSRALKDFVGDGVSGMSGSSQ